MHLGFCSTEALPCSEVRGGMRTKGRPLQIVTMKFHSATASSNGLYFDIYLKKKKKKKKHTFDTRIYNFTQIQIVILFFKR